MKNVDNLKKTIPVEHFIFDFTGHILQMKFKKIRNGIQPKQKEFNELDLATILDIIMQ